MDVSSKLSNRLSRRVDPLISDSDDRILNANASGRCCWQVA